MRDFMTRGYVLCKGDFKRLNAKVGDFEFNTVKRLNTAEGVLLLLMVSQEEGITFVQHVPDAEVIPENQSYHNRTMREQSEIINVIISADATKLPEYNDIVFHFNDYINFVKKLKVDLFNNSLDEIIHEVNAKAYFRNLKKSINTEMKIPCKGIGTSVGFPATYREIKGDINGLANIIKGRVTDDWKCLPLVVKYFLLRHLLGMKELNELNEEELRDFAVLSKELVG